MLPIVSYTVKNTVISPTLYGVENFHTRKLGEMTAFFTV